MKEKIAERIKNLENERDYCLEVMRNPKTDRATFSYNSACISKLWEEINFLKSILMDLIVESVKKDCKGE